MSNHLAIATASAALSQLLQGSVAADVPGAIVRLGKPEANVSAATGPEAFLYLYQVSPNAAYRNADLPVLSEAGQLLQRPRAAFDLHYLISFAGDDGRLEPQRLLGSVVRMLHTQPVLCRHVIRDVIANPAFSFLAASDLADDVELVKFTPLPLTLEELSKLWSVFFQIPYLLSVVYQGTVVLIESSATPQPALPVRERNVYPSPFRFPTIDDVASHDGTNRRIVAGSTIVVTGKQLRGDVTLITIGGIDVTPATVSDTRITLQLPADLRAGVQALQVKHQVMIGTPLTPHRGVQSNVAPLVLCPTITSMTASGTEATFEMVPEVGAAQRVVLLLNERALASPASYTLAATPRTSDSTTIRVPLGGVKTGTEYFVRVQVDGAESPLELDEASASCGPVMVIP